MQLRDVKRFDMIETQIDGRTHRILVLGIKTIGRKTYLKGQYNELGVVRKERLVGSEILNVKLIERLECES